MNKFWRISIYIGLPFCVLGVIICLCVLCYRLAYVNNLGFDYLGVIVGILAILVTILLGWNIATALDIKEEWKVFQDKQSKERDKQNKEYKNLREQIEKLDNENKALQSDMIMAMVLSFDATAKVYISKQNWEGALNACLQALNHSIVDIMTNLRLGNIEKIRRQIIEILYIGNNPRNPRGINFADRREIEYLQGLIEDIESNPNYPIVKNNFDRILEYIRGFLSE